LLHPNVRLLLLLKADFIAPRQRPSVIKVVGRNKLIHVFRVQLMDALVASTIIVQKWHLKQSNVN
jgi:hypothetical protein